MPKTTTASQPDTSTAPHVPAHPAPRGITLAEVGGLLAGNAFGGGDQATGERELVQVVTALRAEGSTIPTDTDLALTRLAQFDQLRRVEDGDVAGIIARADLAQLDPWTLDTLVSNTAVQHVRQGEGAAVTTTIRTALLRRAVDALAVSVHDLLSPLAPAFRTALVDVQTAADAGIGPDTTPADIIDSDDAVAAWRRLVAPDSGVGRLTRLWRLRCRLVRLIGCHVPAAPTPVPQTDALTEALARMHGNSYDDNAATAPTGTSDGWGRAGRTAWLEAAAHGRDLVTEFVDPLLVPARIDERTGRHTVPADSPTRWDLEQAAVTPPAAVDPPAVYPASAYLDSQLVTS